MFIDHSSSSAGKESACTSGDPSLNPGSSRSPGEGTGYPLWYSWASLVAQTVKNLPTGGRPGFDPWVGTIPWRGEWLPIPVFWPGEFHGQRSLADYSPQGREESDMTERLSLHFTSGDVLRFILCHGLFWQSDETYICLCRMRF